jgi:hypothetical protein
MMTIDITRKRDRDPPWTFARSISLKQNGQIVIGVVGCFLPHHGHVSRSGDTGVIAVPQAAQNFAPL